MIIENDSYWCLAKPHWKHNGTLQFLSEGGDWNSVPTKENVMTFSTKKEAEEYIRIKKITTCYSDLSDYKPVKVVEQYKITKR